MFCGKCGSEIPEGMNFCVNCGKKAHIKEERIINKTGKRLKKLNTKTTNTEREQTNKQSFSKKAFALALAVVLPIMMGAVLLIKSPDGTLQGIFRISVIEPSDIAVA